MQGAVIDHAPELRKTKVGRWPLDVKVLASGNRKERVYHIEVEGAEMLREWADAFAKAALVAQSPVQEDWEDDDEDA